MTSRIISIAILGAFLWEATAQTPISDGSSGATETEYLKLLEQDDAAQTDADRWIREAKEFEVAGAGESRETLVARIEQRFDAVRKRYEEFLQKYPRHVQARLAYGSFLNETRDEDKGVEQWERAREIDPKHPAAWNNLANHYGHRGPVKKAFEYYEQAIVLAPDEPVYLQNLATTTYLFRKDAKEHYGFTEDQVFDRAIDLYRKAVKMDPKNFPLATDYAQTFYGIKPLRVDDALRAWNEALAVANDQLERDGVYLHLARIELMSGRFNEARKHLSIVTNQMYNPLKERLARNLDEKEAKASEAPGPQNIKQ
ncbi:MAG: tetratricopeptide repeat protein [Verrucomicrobia bacterium]|nr:tetratricopeptide repeat protein [Verrucomicrobiota bacterium]